MTMKTIRLRKGGERRAASGHLWLYSNELELSDAPLSNGDDVVVEDHKGRLVGSGLYSSHSLIAVRLYAPLERTPFDRAHLLMKLGAAIDLRKRLLGGAARNARIVFAEGDYLPGLIVDRFEEWLSVQLGVPGTDQRKEEIISALSELLNPSGIILRNDTRARELEGLPRYVETTLGTLPEELVVAYNDLKLTVDLAGGQKTGFFFDQRQNYGLLQPVAGGARVLDAFCYSGAWGLHALKWGASSVDFLDASAGALSLAARNAALNGFGNAEYLCLDALDHLKGKPEPYDIVVLDPPAFVKSRKKLEEAVKGYVNLNKWGLRAVKPGGFLITCSCSHHVRPEEFIEIAALAAREAGRRVTVCGMGRQGPDHPWQPALAETDYLKVLLLNVL